jgi:hypothetical protein
MDEEEKLSRIVQAMIAIQNSVNRDDTEIALVGA